MNFLADSMLGKLAKWLRILGYDTTYPAKGEDKKLIELAQREKRILLTRDRGLAKNWTVKTFLVKSETVDEQLEEVVYRFKLNTEKNLLCRCPICNLCLIEIEKKKVEGKVPVFVYKTYGEFWNCEGCGRFYWAGTHWENIREKVNRLRRKIADSQRPKNKTCECKDFS